MGDILDIVQTVSGLFLDILDIVECCESGGDFPGKMGKVLRLVWGSPANAGGNLYLPGATTFYTLYSNCIL